MDNSDKEIKDFFVGMKNSDSRIEVPDFRQLAAHRKKGRVQFMAVAASLIVVIMGCWYILTKTEEPPAVEIIITEKKDVGSMSLMASDGTIEEWKSPTQSLINDF
ncbi:MAG: hypothetical protein AAGA02_15400 [Bacteroidota bacterium]